MKKQIILCGISLTALAGCSNVNEQQLHSVQSQVSQLQQKVGKLEGDLSQSNNSLAKTKGELEIVKKQRVIRLPTGAPLETRARKSTITTPSPREQQPASNPIRRPVRRPVIQPAGNREELAIINGVIKQYKSGNIGTVIPQFENFLRRYPNSKYRYQAQYYIGQAAYTSGDYLRSQAALEPLVFQSDKVNQSAARLLKMVYKEQGNAKNQTRLSQFLATPKDIQFSPPKLFKTVPIDTAAAIKSTLGHRTTPAMNNAVKNITRAAINDPNSVSSEGVRRAKVQVNPIRPYIRK